MGKLLDLLLKQGNDSLKEWNVKVNLHKSFVVWIIDMELQNINLQAYELYRQKDRLEENQRRGQSELGKLKFHEESLKEELHRLSIESTRMEERCASTSSK